MAINTNHPEYDMYQEDWQRSRDAKAGQSTVHRMGTKYLAKLIGQDDGEYKAYVDRALFYEATGRTIDGLKGMLFRKNMQVEVNGMADFLMDVTLDGEDINTFAKNCADEILTVGRVGILVDYPRIDTLDMTAAQADMINSRPFFRMYKAETITNWRMGRVLNSGDLMEVRLKEVIELETDEFEYKEIEQYRVLDIYDGYYRQRIYQKDKDRKWQLIDEIIPLRNGTRMDYIPFVFIGVDGFNVNVCRPPLAGLVNVNFSHYKTTADLEHGAHFTGLPTAVIAGVTDTEDGEYRIGSTTAWAFSNPDTKASYLEFTGQGLGALEKLIQTKEDKMASLGAQMLTPSTRRNEAAETAGLRHLGEHSVMASISLSLADCINKLLEFAGDWMGLSPAIVDINKDFMPTPISPQMLKELFVALQGGGISHQTYFEQLQKGEIIDADKTFEEEKAEIETQIPIEM